MQNEIVGFGLETKSRGYASSSPDKVFTDEQLIEAAFKYFREHGFPTKNLPVHVCMQEIEKLARSRNKALFRSTVGYSVADSYHKHRFEGRYHTKKLSPFELFQDDKWLRYALEKEIKYSNKKIGTHLHSLDYAGESRACFNFRPAFALYLYRKYCKPGDIVLDTSTGYGGRLVGFFASKCGRYIGIDPNNPTYKANLKMAADFGRAGDVELYDIPAEDVDPDILRGRCDFAFTSPPYFRTEIYSPDNTQSCNRYTEQDTWKNGFLFPLMKLQFSSIKDGCYALMNVADTKFKGNGKEQIIPLVDWTIEAGLNAGFKHEATKTFKLQTYFGVKRKADDGLAKPAMRTECVCIFRKD